jgi:diaminopimelate decarboxylase
MFDSWTAEILFAVSLVSLRFIGDCRRRKKPSSTCSCSQKEKHQTLVEEAKFLNVSIAAEIKSKFRTPVYVYDEKSLISQAEKALAFPNPFGLTVRFAMKSCPNATVLRLFDQQGIRFDASSGYEVMRAIKAGIKPENISLSSQELPHNFQELISLGIEFNACSLKQLEEYGKNHFGGSCGIRFNPGKGSGGTGKTVRTFDFVSVFHSSYISLVERRWLCSFFWYLV